MCAQTGPLATVSRLVAAPLIVDLDQDGRRDVVTPNTVTDSVTVLLGQGDGSFRHGLSLALQQGGVGFNRGPTSAVAGDFTADGVADLVVSDGIDR